ncbi:MAG: cytochrome c biogenesis protein CcsA [bacterium]|nr:cytochrome c biogenesis protein CcsA [bacterium]
MHNKYSNMLFGILVIMMLISIYLVFIYVPAERTMGDIQRIFYFHVSSAWVAFFAFAVTFFCSAAFLIKKDLKWDNIAVSSAEIGLIFTTIALITGSIWARPVWGVWWTWDARLTSTLVLWLIYLSYLMLRNFIESETKRAFLSSVVGIIGFLDVFFVYFSIRWWRTQHPAPVIAGGSDSGLAPPMLFTLIFCLVTFSILYFYLLNRKVNIGRASWEIEDIYRTLDNN